MIIYIEKRRRNIFVRILSGLVAFNFLFSLILPPSYAQFVVPTPNAMIGVSPAYFPAIIKGLTINAQDPLKFDFIVDTGDTRLSGDALKQESTKLIKYFLASLTVPEEDLWVNLSPYEKDRIIPQGFGLTEMGRDLLSQDYILKQLTASLMYPENDLGKKFWDRVRAKAKEKFGTTDIPMNAFNKVWIVPKKAQIYEHEGTAFIIDSKLEVMLEEDYLALMKNLDNQKFGLDQVKEDKAKDSSAVTSAVVREVIIPEIEKEVNEGKNFANLRQIYNAMILATWYKIALKESILSKIYVDKNKVSGVESDDKDAKLKIYQKYLEAFKKGAYDYIKEEYDPATQEVIPRKYVSGGFSMQGADGAMLSKKVGASRVTDAILAQYPSFRPGIIRAMGPSSPSAKLVDVDSGFLEVTRNNGSVLKENADRLASIDYRRVSQELIHPDDAMVADDFKSMQQLMRTMDLNHLTKADLAKLDEIERFIRGIYSSRTINKEGLKDRYELKPDVSDEDVLRAFRSLSAEISKMDRLTPEYYILSYSNSLHRWIPNLRNMIENQKTPEPSSDDAMTAKKKVAYMPKPLSDQIMHQIESDHVSLFMLKKIEQRALRKSSANFPVSSEGDRSRNIAEKQLRIVRKAIENKEESLRTHYDLSAVLPETSVYDLPLSKSTKDRLKRRGFRNAAELVELSSRKLSAIAGPALLVTKATNEILELGSVLKWRFATIDSRRYTLTFPSRNHELDGYRIVALGDRLKGPLNVIFSAPNDSNLEGGGERLNKAVVYTPTDFARLQRRLYTFSLPVLQGDPSTLRGIRLVFREEASKDAAMTAKPATGRISDDKKVLIIKPLNRPEIKISPPVAKTGRFRQFVFTDNFIIGPDANNIVAVVKGIKAENSKGVDDRFNVMVTTEEDEEPFYFVVDALIVSNIYLRNDGEVIGARFTPGYAGTETLKIRLPTEMDKGKGLNLVSGGSLIEEPIFSTDNRRVAVIYKTKEGHFNVAARVDGGTNQRAFTNYEMLYITSIESIDFTPDEKSLIVHYHRQGAPMQIRMELPDAAMTAKAIKNQTILVVEPHPLIRELLEAKLKTEGYDVIVADTASKAIEKLASSPSVNLVILGYEMEKSHVFAREVNSKNIPILLSHDPKSSLENLPFKINDTIALPFSGQAVLKKIQGAIGSPDAAMIADKEVITVAGILLNNPRISLDTIGQLTGLTDQQVKASLKVLETSGRLDILEQQPYFELYTLTNQGKDWTKQTEESLIQTAIREVVSSPAIARQVIARKFPGLSVEELVDRVGLSIDSVRRITTAMRLEGKLIADQSTGTIKYLLPDAAMTAKVSQRTILVVDDDPGYLDTHTKFFADRGYPILKAGNAEQAAELVQRHPEIGFVITDLHMPGQSGVELARNLEIKGFDVPIAIITGIDLPESVRRAMSSYSSNIRGIFVKDYDSQLEELATLVRKYISPDAAMTANQSTVDSPPLDFARGKQSTDKAMLSEVEVNAAAEALNRPSEDIFSLLGTKLDMRKFLIEFVELLGIPTEETVGNLVKSGLAVRALSELKLTKDFLDLEKLEKFRSLQNQAARSGRSMTRDQLRATFEQAMDSLGLIKDLTKLVIRRDPVKDDELKIVKKLEAKYVFKHFTEKWRQANPDAAMINMNKTGIVVNVTFTKDNIDQKIAELEKLHSLGVTELIAFADSGLTDNLIEALRKANITPLIDEQVYKIFRATLSRQNVYPYIVPRQQGYAYAMDAIRGQLNKDPKDPIYVVAELTLTDARRLEQTIKTMDLKNVRVTIKTDTSRVAEVLRALNFGRLNTVMTTDQKGQGGDQAMLTENHKRFLRDLESNPVGQVMANRKLIRVISGQSAVVNNLRTFPRIINGILTPKGLVTVRKLFFIYAPHMEVYDFDDGLTFVDPYAFSTVQDELKKYGLAQVARWRKWQPITELKNINDALTNAFVIADEHGDIMKKTDAVSQTASGAVVYHVGAGVIFVPARRMAVGAESPSDAAMMSNEAGRAAAALRLDYIDLIDSLHEGMMGNSQQLMRDLTKASGISQQELLALLKRRKFIIQRNDDFVFNRNIFIQVGQLAFKAELRKVSAKSSPTMNNLAELIVKNVDADRFFSAVTRKLAKKFRTTEQKQHQPAYELLMEIGFYPDLMDRLTLRDYEISEVPIIQSIALNADITPEIYTPAQEKRILEVEAQIKKEIQKLVALERYRIRLRFSTAIDKTDKKIEAAKKRIAELEVKRDRLKPNPDEAMLGDNPYGPRASDAAMISSVISGQGPVANKLNNDHRALTTGKKDAAMTASILPGSMREILRVADVLYRAPSISIRNIARLSELTEEEVRRVIRHFRDSGFIKITDLGHELYGFNDKGDAWTETTEEALMIDTIKQFVDSDHERKKNGVSAAEVAFATGLTYKRIDFVLNSMRLDKKLKFDNSSGTTKFFLPDAAMTADQKGQVARGKGQGGDRAMLVLSEDERAKIRDISMPDLLKIMRRLKFAKTRRETRNVRLRKSSKSDKELIAVQKDLRLIEQERDRRLRLTDDIDKLKDVFPEVKVDWRQAVPPIIFSSIPEKNRRKMEGGLRRIALQNDIYFYGDDIIRMLLQQHALFSLNLFLKMHIPGEMDALVQKRHSVETSVNNLIYQMMDPDDFLKAMANLTGLSKDEVETKLKSEKLFLPLFSSDRAMLITPQTTGHEAAAPMIMQGLTDEQRTSINKGEVSFVELTALETALLQAIHATTEQLTTVHLEKDGEILNRRIQLSDDLKFVRDAKAKKSASDGAMVSDQITQITKELHIEQDLARRIFSQLSFSAQFVEDLFRATSILEKDGSLDDLKREQIIEIIQTMNDVGFLEKTEKGRFYGMYDFSKTYLDQDVLKALCEALRKYFKKPGIDLTPQKVEKILIDSMKYYALAAGAKILDIYSQTQLKNMTREELNYAYTQYSQRENLYSSRSKKEIGKGNFVPYVVDYWRFLENAAKAYKSGELGKKPSDGAILAETPVRPPYEKLVEDPHLKTAVRELKDRSKSRAAYRFIDDLIPAYVRKMGRTKAYESFVGNLERTGYASLYDYREMLTAMDELWATIEANARQNDLVTMETDLARLVLLAQKIFVAQITGQADGAMLAIYNVGDYLEIDGIGRMTVEKVTRPNGQHGTLVAGHLDDGGYRTVDSSLYQGRIKRFSRKISEPGPEALTARPELPGHIYNGGERVGVSLPDVGYKLATVQKSFSPMGPKLTTIVILVDGETQERTIEPDKIKVTKLLYAAGSDGAMMAKTDQEKLAADLRTKPLKEVLSAWNVDTTKTVIGAEAIKSKIIALDVRTIVFDVALGIVSKIAAVGLVDQDAQLYIGNGFVILNPEKAKADEAMMALSEITEHIKIVKEQKLPEWLVDPKLLHVIGAWYDKEKRSTLLAALRTYSDIPDSKERLIEIFRNRISKLTEILAQLAHYREMGLLDEKTFRQVTSKHGDDAMLGTANVGDRKKAEYGGINLNPSLLDLQIKRDGNGVPLPLNQQPLQNIHIEGFMPIIFNITPIQNLPLLLGLFPNKPSDKDSDLSLNLSSLKATKEEELVGK